MVSIDAFWSLWLAPTDALAQQAATREIVLGPYNVSTASPSLPVISVVPNAPMELRVINPTPTPLTFSSPDLGVDVTVPANAERRISIDPAMTANLTPGQQVAYYIVDPSGERIASGYMVNEEVAYRFEQTTTQTSTQPEEVTPTAPPARRSTVRGYW
jgi:hypothetical protein